MWHHSGGDEHSYDYFMMIYDEFLPKPVYTYPYENIGIWKAVVAYITLHPKSQQQYVDHSIFSMC